MSTVEYAWKTVEGDDEHNTFGDWLDFKVNQFWGPLGIDIDAANALDDEVKQQVYEFVRAGVRADEDLEITFPLENETMNALIGYEHSESASVEDVDKAGAEGLAAGGNLDSSLKNNPYARFNHHLWRTWRSHFVKGRKESQAAAAEPAAVEPAEPGLTVQQRRLLEIDAEIVDLNPRVRAAQNLVDSLKEDLKVAKNDLDELLEEQADLCNKISIISEGGSYQPKLPFSEEPHPDVEAGKNRPHGTPLMNAAARVLKEDPAIKAPIHDLGKAELVGDLALTPAIIDKLMDNEFEFIYKLEDRIKKASIGGWSWFKDVTGIGKNAASKIEDAREAWRRINPMPDPDEDDEPEETEAEAAEEEPDTIPMKTEELQWWCCECNHTWPLDGDNDVCPECENEAGNEKVGYHSSPDANELGLIVRNFEDVPIMEEVNQRCIVRVYEVNQLWLSSIFIEDMITPYGFSNNLDLADYGSTSRDAAIWNELSRLEESDDVPDSIRQAASEYVDMHLKDLPGDHVRCLRCESTYIFNSETEKPCCPFCNAVEHTPAD